MFSSEKFSRLLILIGIIAVVVFTIFFFYNIEPKIETFGQYGDFIGGIVGSLWALAGVILFYVALKTQRKDYQNNKEVLKTQVKALEKQIEEFQLQREELKLTRKVFTEQGKTLRLQQFESTFFNSLSLLNNITNSIKIDKFDGNIVYKETAEGRESFESFYYKLRKFYQNDNLDKRFDIELDTENIDEKFIEIKTINSIYKDFYKNNTQYLSHYFNTLYNIIHLIDKKTSKDNDYYINILKAQLSTYENLILFYHCLSEYGDNFKLLVEKYGLLDNLNEDLLLNSDHTNLFNKSAF